MEIDIALEHAELVLLRVDRYLRRQHIELAVSDTLIDGYRNDIGNLVQELLRGSGRMSKAQFRRDMKGIIKSYAREGFQTAWEEDGGDVSEAEASDTELIAEWQTEQQGYVDSFADWLKDKTSDLDFVDSRIESWAASFRNFVERIKLRAEGNPMLKYDGDDGRESCDECQEYKGQSHRLSWWEKRGLTKRNGNDNYGCGRWEPCQHHFYNSKGDVVIA